MSFSKDFIWGCATASYQIEGAAYEDGKGLSVWDTFCKQPGRVFEGHSGDVACDHYHHFREDVALMREIGLKAYRFSISWPRILPNGYGEVNEKGLQFYENLVDALLEAGIVPYATLFHWDYPQALLERGGWLNPDSPDWFNNYIAVVAKRLGGKIRHFFTLNEPQCFIGLSYQKTIHAPGLAYSLRDGLQMAHHVLLAHGKAVKTLRELVPGCQVGCAPTFTTYYPASDDPKDIEAARLATFDLQKDWGFSAAWWNDPVMLGAYPAKGEAVFGKDMPRIQSGDMELIRQPLDFFGQNIYNSRPVRDDGNGGWKMEHLPAGFPKTAINWPVTPQSLYWPVKFSYERYQTPILITENGMSAIDAVSLDGKVHDPERINFLRRYLRELRRACEDGVPVKGYFHWSLMDNFEWAEGYNERFGLIYIDYQTQKRTLKDSAYWYKEVLESNGENL